MPHGKKLKSMPQSREREPLPGIFGKGLMFEGAIPENVPVYLQNEEDRERAAVGGVEVGRVGQSRVLRPLMSKADFADMKFGQLTPVTGHEDAFYPFLRPGTDPWRRYMATRKVVENVDPEGRVSVCIAPNMGEKLSEVVDSPAVAKSYSLVAVLTDSTVHDKYDMPLSLLHSLRALAIPQPDAAARQAQEYMARTRPDLDIKVSAGDYSRSSRRCRDAIREFCSAYPSLSATIDSCVVGRELVMYGPGPENLRFSVAGPMSEAESVALVFRAVEICGPGPVSFALGYEITVLRIDVFDGDSCVCPEIVKHVGQVGVDLPEESSKETASLLTPLALTQLADMRTSIVEVRKDDRLLGSSVRISGRYGLMPTHLCEIAGATVDGIEYSSVREITKDLWLIRAVGPGSAVWPLREAVPGERAVVCYRGPKGTVQYTCPLSVLSSNETGLSLSRSAELCPGMSGGAVVALDDLALLGVYEGASPTQALASVFTPAMFAELHAAPTASSVRTDLESPPMVKLIQRGLGDYVKAAVNSVKPLYGPRGFVGVCVDAPGGPYTVLNPDSAPLALELGGQPSVFSAVPNTLWYGANRNSHDVGTSMLVRPANYYERVVIVSLDGDGTFYSGVTRVVHVGVGGKNFSLEGVPPDDVLTYQGGLVISLDDAAVLGAVVRTTVSEALGQVEFCVALPPIEKKKSTLGVDSQLAWLERVFPALHPRLWPAGMLEEVFTHSSVQRYRTSPRPFNQGMAPLAFVGDAAMKLHFGTDLRERAVPVARWQTQLQAQQSNAALARLSQELGLDTQVIFGGGTLPPRPGAKVYADVIEALAGAVYLAESTQVFTSFMALLRSRMDRGGDSQTVDPTSPIDNLPFRFASSRPSSSSDAVSSV